MDCDNSQEEYDEKALRNLLLDAINETKKGVKKTYGKRTAKTYARVMNGFAKDPDSGLSTHENEWRDLDAAISKETKKRRARQQRERAKGIKRSEF